MKDPAARTARSWQGLRTITQVINMTLAHSSVPFREVSADRLHAMHEASVGAFEAAKSRYEHLRKQTEVVSLAYVRGEAERPDVKRLVEKLLDAEYMLRASEEQVRVCAEAVREIA